MWHRQRGIGERLVEAVLDGVRRSDLPSIRLLVTADNHSAMAFYRRLGFELTGNETPHANDSSSSDCEMILDPGRDPKSRKSRRLS